MRPRHVASIATAVLALAGAAPARAVERAGTAPEPGYVPGELVVRTRDPGTGEVRAVRHVIRDGDTVREEARELERRPGVLSATPNYIARASAYIPNDPGNAGVPGGWQALQWNFLAGTGVNAPEAWTNLRRAGRPGGRGVVVAILDTGIAYRDAGSFRRSPDIDPKRIVRGYDFVDRDALPIDENGHGTHVAGTIGETANNRVGLTGLAYGAKLMPVRVLDRAGEGDSLAISAGIRYAVRHRARVINLSFEFGTAVTAGEIPELLDALRYARRRRVLVVGASGNGAATALAYPARASQVFAVGATTEHGCIAGYSNTGRGLDIVAPGGGEDADLPAEAPRCRPADAPGRDIFQMTLLPNTTRRFGLPDGFEGTSMAAPHVSAIAALVIASGVIGRRPSPAAIEHRLKVTATPLGPRYRYGAGLVDAWRATAPLAPAR
jgi:serine protease